MSSQSLCRLFKNLNFDVSFKRFGLWKHTFSKCQKYSNYSSFCHSNKYPLTSSGKIYDNIINAELGEHRSPKSVLANEFTPFKDGNRPLGTLLPPQSDIIIIGGGAIGLCAAYWLLTRHPEGFKISIIERDPKLTQCASVMSVGGLRQQFSVPENIKMSLFTAEFLRNIRENLSVVDMDPPDICFKPLSYMFLASEEGASTLRSNYEMQIKTGAEVSLMEKNELRSKYSWLNCDDISLASIGLHNEGHFDPWLFLATLKAKVASLGGQFIHGELVDFLTGDPLQDGTIRERVLESAVVRNNEDGNLYAIRSSMFLNCTGPWARDVGHIVGIGKGTGPMGIPIPIEPRKRYVYVFHCPDGPIVDMPMLIDNSGIYVRPEGLSGNYICGASPSEDEEPDTNDLDVDYRFFEEYIWPKLAHRVPAFANLKVKNAWAGYYDYNYFDQNLIIGNHTSHPNLFIAAGCSGHGIQQAPAIGRALSELILDDEYTTIDLSRFTFDRVVDEDPLLESCIV